MSKRMRTVRWRNVEYLPSMGTPDEYVVSCECGRKVRFQDYQAARCHCGRLYISEVKIRFDDSDLYTEEEAAILDERFGREE